MMAINRRREYLPHPLVIVVSSTDAELPEVPLGREITSASKNCIYVGTQASVDGPVEVVLTDEAVAIPETWTRLGNFTLEVGEVQAVGIFTTEWDLLVRLSFDGPVVALEVAGSDDYQPNQLVVRVLNS